MRSQRAYLIGLILIAVGAFVVTLLATRWGIGTSPDSARYIRSARHALGREPEAPVVIEAPAEQAHYPPLYPSVLALLSVGGADPLDAARWLNAVLLAFNALFAAELVRRATGSSAAALCTAAIVAFSPASIAIHAWALSEPLFIFLSLLAMRVLMSHLDRPHWRKLVAASILTGAALLTRYAGVYLFPTTLLILLMLGSRSPKQRVIEACIFIAIAACFPFGWSIRNALVLGSATNRVIAFHPLSLAHLIDLAQVCWNWLGADEPVHPVLTFLAALVAFAVLIGALRSTVKLSRAMLLYIACFGLMLLLSISLIDFHTPVDGRVLSPVYVAWVVLVGCVLARVLRQPSSKWHAAITAVVIALGAWMAVRSTILVQQLFTNGGGYAQRGLQQSAVIAALKTMPRDQYVYTNAPGAVYLLTNWPVIITIPSEFSASSTLRNPNFDTELARMESDLHARKAVLVYLGRFARARSTAPNDAQLRRRFGLHPLVRQKTDAIYDYVPPATTTTTPAATQAINARE